MDVHVPGPVTEGLRRRNIDVLTSQDDGTDAWDDVRLMERATELGRVLVSQDKDLLRIVSEYQDRGELFSGLIFAHQLNIGIGDFIRDLEMIAFCCEPPDLANQVTYIPLP